jgi:hypothetical protein
MSSHSKFVRSLRATSTIFPGATGSRTTGLASNLVLYPDPNLRGDNRVVRGRKCYV